EKPEQKEKVGLFTGAHPILTDRREQVITPGGTEVETTFEVVEAADLISSDHPRFPKQYQPRKRERKTSEDQIRHIVANFDPLQLGASRVASHGAPIIGMDDNYVESGNGRVMAIRKVYDNHPALATKYRKFVAHISGVDVSKMKQPVLVRRRQTEMTDEQRVKWAREANKDTLMQMSAAEKAAIDQEKLTPSVMSELPDNMDEPLKLVAGKGLEFVTQFVAQFSPHERGELVDADGKVSTIALNRAKTALLQKAYGGTPAGDAAIRRASESTDTDAQSLVNTLMRFGPAFAQLKDEIAAGRVQEQADIGSQIAEAVEVVRSAGTPGAVTRWLNTEGLLDPKDATVKQLIHTFYTFDGRGDAKRLRSAAAIGDTLSGYLTLARQHTPAGAGGGLFGDEATAVLNPAAELAKLTAGRKEQEQRSERQETTQRSGQGGLFTAGGKPSEAASAGTGDESGGEETQPTGLGESGYGSDTETSAEADEEVTDLDDDIGAKAAEDDYEDDDSGVEAGMDDSGEDQGDAGVEAGAIEEGRNEREGERVPLPSTTRENLMRALNIEPATFRAWGGKKQWETVRQALKDRFGFADIILHSKQFTRNAVDHLLDAFESLDNLAEALKAGSRIASLGGRITLHMREKAKGKTKAYFRYKPEGNEPGNTIAIHNQGDWYSHELAHAIDYDMMERAGGNKPGGLTRMIRDRENTGTLPNTLVQAMADVYNAMYYDGAAIAALIHKAEHQLLQAKTPSDKARLQKRLDNLRTGAWRGTGAGTDFYKRAKNGPMAKYLTKPTEFFARVFEAYVSHKIQGQKDMGLVKFLGATDAIYSNDADAWIKRVYPHGADRQAIFATLDNLVGQIMRQDVYNVGTQSPGMQQSHVNLGLIDPVAQAKANGTPLTPDIIRAHNLTNKAAQTFLEDELKRNDSMWKNFVQLVDDLRDGRPGAAEKLNAVMSKLASTPDTVMQFLEMRFPNIPTLRTIRNQLSDAHIAGRNKPVGFYREWQRTEHSIT
ncbi:MAG TPA: LPD1 domain-containing protein, partial [Steroidobacteraceae bacterium]|nr:LPD1 domain-containing protein [Steroidobacteraceae bacterium]